MLDNLESRVSQVIEQRLEHVMSSLVDRLNLNSQPAPPVANISPDANLRQPNELPNSSTPFWQRDLPNLANNSNQNFHRQIDQFRFSDISSVPNSGRVAQLISSWDIKFDGSPKLSVDSFCIGSNAKSLIR